MKRNLIPACAILALLSAASALTAGPITNGGFESGLSPWTSSGNVFVQGAFPSATGPLTGAAQAWLETDSNGQLLGTTPAGLETFLGLTAGTLQANVGVGNVVDRGSAILQSFTANAGDSISFNWNFVTADTFPDYAFFVFGQTGSMSLTVLDAATDGTLTMVGAGPYFETTTQTGIIPIASSGSYFLGFGVVNAGVGAADDSVDSNLLIDNVAQSTGGVPEPRTTILLGAGLAVIAALGLRKKKLMSNRALSLIGMLIAGSSLSMGAGTLLISQFRLRGPNGANDEFVEIYNNNDAPHTVASISGTGYGLYASDGVLRGTIPNGTVIPGRGHFLITNNSGYSYSTYPAGTISKATPDAIYVTDIPDNAGIALFNNNSAALTLANRFDAVGSTSEANTLYKEGTGYSALTPFSIEYAFVRNMFPGITPQDTDNNAADFTFVDTNGTSAGAGQHLGAPGPSNLSSPIQMNSSITCGLADPTVPASLAPNRAVDSTSNPANNSTFGTVSYRRACVNNTGAPVTRLRFRITSITTFPAPSGIADLRPITSSDTAITVNGIGNVHVFGTTLEVDNTAPSTGQPNGGGINSSMSADFVTIGAPVQPGATFYVQFLNGFQQTGRERFNFNVEASVPPPPTNSILISEFRLRGPNGASDEFIEILNNSNAPHTVAAVSGTGYGLFASDGLLRGTIPNGTVIPAHGHFLMTNSAGYTYNSYPAGNGTTATGDATYTTDIPDNAGIALFTSNLVAGATLANRLDAVGSSTEANTLYKDGLGYPPLTPFSIESSWVRNTVATGEPQQTHINAADFLFVDTNGTSAGGGQRLGAPGPENLSGPKQSFTAVSCTLADPAVDTFAAPNRVVSNTSDPANNSTFGTIEDRRLCTNDTGSPITRLRFRIVYLTTFPAPSGIADLRPRTSSDAVISITGLGSVTAHGTTLEVDNTAPSTGQPNGGGFNSSWGVPAVSLATPLAAGASIYVRFLSGVQQTGFNQVLTTIETLP